MDIAVLTNDASNSSCTAPTQGTCTARCKYYLENSFNKNRKGYCDVKHDGTDPVTRKTGSNAWNNNQWYNNKVAPIACADKRHAFTTWPNRKRARRTSSRGSRSR